MQYYAKTYTADPKTGLLTPGEILTKKQEEALGEDRLADMVKRGILGVTGEEARKSETPVKSEEKPAKKAENAEPEEETEDDGEVPDSEEDDELPELDGAEAIAEEEQPAEPVKKAGRRKTK